MAFDPLSDFLVRHEFFIIGTADGMSVLKSSSFLKYCEHMYIARIDKSPTQILPGQMASVLLKCFKTFSIFGNCSEICVINHDSSSIGVGSSVLSSRDV